MSIALYRRYRPDNFADVIGQEHVTAPLMAALDAGRVTHAYLFSGPRGCGKTTSARIMARCLNCAQGPSSRPCGKCESCIELATGGSGSLDVVEIDAASHNGVDDARELRERAAFAPVRDRYKIFILDEAHMVTSQGFNALLKLVEEPPEHVKFIFATTEPEKVIGTIRSRTHHYPFRLVPPETMQDYLGQLCSREGVEITEGVLPLVVRAGAGSVRDSLSVLDQLMAGSKANRLDYETATALLGYTDISLLEDFTDGLIKADPSAIFALIGKVIETGLDPRRFVEDLLLRLRDLLMLAFSGGEQMRGTMGSIPVDQLEVMLKQAQSLGARTISQAADITNQALSEMTGATAPRLQIELLGARLLLLAEANHPSASGNVEKSGQSTQRGLVETMTKPEPKQHTYRPNQAEEKTSDSLSTVQKAPNLADTAALTAPQEEAPLAPTAPLAPATPVAPATPLAPVAPLSAATSVAEENSLTSESIAAPLAPAAISLAPAAPSSSSKTSEQVDNPNLESTSVPEVSLADSILKDEERVADISANVPNLPDTSVAAYVEPIVDTTCAVEESLEEEKVDSASADQVLSLELAQQIKLTFYANWEKLIRVYQKRDLTGAQSILNYGQIVLKPLLAKIEKPGTIEIRFPEHVLQNLIASEKNTQIEANLAATLAESNWGSWQVNCISGYTDEAQLNGEEIALLRQIQAKKIADLVTLLKKNSQTSSLDSGSGVENGEQVKDPAPAEITESGTGSLSASFSEEKLQNDLEVKPYDLPISQQAEITGAYSVLPDKLPNDKNYSPGDGVESGMVSSQTWTQDSSQKESETQELGHYPENPPLYVSQLEEYPPLDEPPYEYDEPVPVYDEPAPNLGEQTQNHQRLQANVLPNGMTEAADALEPLERTEETEVSEIVTLAPLKLSNPVENTPSVESSSYDPWLSEIPFPSADNLAPAPSVTSVIETPSEPAPVGIAVKNVASENSDVVSGSPSEIAEAAYTVSNPVSPAENLPAEAINLTGEHNRAELEEDMPSFSDPDAEDSYLVGIQVVEHLLEAKIIETIPEED